MKQHSWKNNSAVGTKEKLKNVIYSSKDLLRISINYIAAMTKELKYWNGDTSPGTVETQWCNKWATELEKLGNAICKMWKDQGNLKNVMELQNRLKKLNDCTRNYGNEAQAEITEAKKLS